MKIRTQIWMVEQQHQIGEHYVAIRGVVRAMTRKKAQERAEAGCASANEILSQQHNSGYAKPAGDAYALYPIADA